MTLTSRWPSSESGSSPVTSNVVAARVQSCREIYTASSRHAAEHACRAGPYQSPSCRRNDGDEYGTAAVPAKIPSPPCRFFCGRAMQNHIFDMQRKRLLDSSLRSGSGSPGSSASRPPRWRLPGVQDPRGPFPAFAAASWPQQSGARLRCPASAPVRPFPQMVVMAESRFDEMGPKAPPSRAAVGLCYRVVDCTGRNGKPPTLKPVQHT